MSKKLVAYFSASGITKKTAKMIAEATGADLHEIVPQEIYTAEDLDWKNKESRSSVEMKNKSFRPALAESDLSVDGYDEIFVGFPIWWNVAPTIVNTFLEKYDFSGKKIIVFATSGGSNISSSVAELKPSAPNAEVVEGKLLNGATMQDIKDWLNA